VVLAYPPPDVVATSLSQRCAEVVEASAARQADALTG
jgi:hypothetical protein